jgi:hypothetical protein
MAKKKSEKAAVANLDSVRKGGTRVDVENSGLEVWLYDEANLAAIRDSKSKDKGAGGMPPNFVAQTKKGLVVGYSMEGDGAVDPAIYVGKPFSDEELSAARWLEPQTAFLQLPSGTLRVESNDVSRIGPEVYSKKGGARVEVPKGDYKLTLYRIDMEAMDRESIKWKDPYEVIVLTPGGTKKDAASDLLSFEPRRDLTWVGKYSIDGRRAEALVWFDDSWDTYTLNLDAAALKKLGLKIGGYFRTTVSAAGLTLHSSFAASWDDARRLPEPAGLELDEYGYAAPLKRGEWGDAETLFCRREATKKGVEDKHKSTWLPAVVEVLDVKAQEKSGTGSSPANLEKKEYFDSGFLQLILSDVLPEASDMDELPLPDALKRLDKAFGKMSLVPQGDRCWKDQMDTTARFYTGLPDMIAAIVAAEGIFLTFFLSELDDKTWVITGLVDDWERFIKKKGPTGLFVDNPRVRFTALDEPLADIQKQHKAVLKDSGRKPVAAPTGIDACLEAFTRFQEAAFK